MDLPLIDGVYPRQDAIDLLTEMVALKIRYHERQLQQGQDVEDTRHREARIRRLQEALHAAREHIQQAGSLVSLNSSVHIAPWGMQTEA